MILNVAYFMTTLCIGANVPMDIVYRYTLFTVA